MSIAIFCSLLLSSESGARLLEIPWSGRGAVVGVGVGVWCTPVWAFVLSHGMLLLFVVNVALVVVSRD